MDFTQTLFLGAIAGFTIFLGLPLGRFRSVSQNVRSFLSMASAGILLFLFYDIFGQLSRLIEIAFTPQNLEKFSVLFISSIIGIGIGLLGLIAFEQNVIRRRVAHQDLSARELALMIAIGIGMHNFSEGLAIGQSAERGEIAFATILIIGFALHNVTESFGIVGPLAGINRPSWKFLGLVGLISGSPTFLGTVAGYQFRSPLTSSLFLSLAIGALVYVIGELFHINWRSEKKAMAGWGLLAGLLIAYLTDLVLVYVGA